MIKKTAGFLILLFILAGCSAPIQYAVSDQYTRVRPHTIAILPVQWSAEVNKETDGISHLLRTMAGQKLRSMNYRTMPLDEVDGKVGGNLSGKSPAEIARLLGVDAVLYTGVEEWKKTELVTYASLDVKTRFELYSSMGTRLWAAEYNDRDMDLRLDTKPMELAVIKVYEPKMQRIVDACFSTLPQGDYTEGKTKENYFQWLP